MAEELDRASATLKTTHRTRAASRNSMTCGAGVTTSDNNAGFQSGTLTFGATMNAYEFLISDQSADTRAGEMALGYLMEHLRRSPHAAAMASATWPKGWRVYGSALVTPGNTMLVLVEDNGLDMRGARFRFDLVRIGQHVKGLDGDPAHHLIAAGVDPIKAAVWSVLDEWGNATDREQRDALL